MGTEMRAEKGTEMGIGLRSVMMGTEMRPEMGADAVMRGETKKVREG